MSILLLPATTPCDIYLGGLITPPLPYRDAIAQAHFSAIFNNSITSAVFPIRSTVGKLNLHGKMSSDSISFDSTLPEASVQVTYVFKYSKILFVGDKVEIALPSFSGIPTIFQSSCSSTQFGIGHKVLVASNNLLIITLTVGYAPLLSNTDCTVKIDGLKNPNILFETDSGLLQHRVISVSGGMPFLPVTSADGISGGLITDDKIEFTGDPSIGQPTKIKYQFKYDEDITLDSNIVLKMPGWKKQTGASLSAFSDSCGTATNSVYFCSCLRTKR